MKIIILEGDKNKGKTTTMGVVFVALHMKGCTVKTFIPVPSPSGMDFEAVLDYPNPDGDEKSNLKVAMYSKGDNIADCNDAINRYSQQNTDVLIIAYSAKKTRFTIPAKDTHVCVQKTVVPPSVSEVKSNAKDSKKIISKI